MEPIHKAARHAHSGSTLRPRRAAPVWIANPARAASRMPQPAILTVASQLYCSTWLIMYRTLVVPTQPLWACWNVSAYQATPGGTTMSAGSQNDDCRTKCHLPVIRIAIGGTRPIIQPFAFVRTATHAIAP